MKSVKLQLLVTVVAILTVAAFVAVRGLPLHGNILLAVDRDNVAEALIAHGAEVDAKPADGMTPLILAASGDPHRERRQERLKVAEILLAHGADVNAEDHYGHTALYYAGYTMQDAMANLLRQHGAKE